VMTLWPPAVKASMPDVARPSLASMVSDMVEFGY
jgi:hypothetical protein